MNSMYISWKDVSEVHCKFDYRMLFESVGTTDYSEPLLTREEKLAEWVQPSRPRRLVLMFDGTGNKRLNLSNVARLFEAIDDSKPQAYKPNPKKKNGEPYYNPERKAYNSTKFFPCDKCGQRVLIEPEQIIKPAEKPAACGSTSDVPGAPCGTCRQLVLEPDQQRVQLVKYIKGVGTDFFLKLSGLGFGYGLSASVIEGYVWLSNNYCEGDEIFVFGFSRGAFSARSFVSLLHRCGGVLKPALAGAGKSLGENGKKLPLMPDVTRKNKPPSLTCDHKLVKAAYAVYQAYVQTGTGQTTVHPPEENKDKGQATGSVKEGTFEYFRKNWREFNFHQSWREFNFRQSWAKFKKTQIEMSYCTHRVEVKMLGVWDTVGALGLPATGWTWLDNKNPFCANQFQFHDEGLSCIVKNAYHALAIDEHRLHFNPTLWEKKRRENDEVKQVWFIGSHCNVGGGADMDDLKDPDDLWQYSYVWMQKHAQKHGLRFYWTYDSPATQRVTAQGESFPTRRVSLREPEDSFSPFIYGLYRWFMLNQPFDRNVIKSRDYDAKLHWSVVERIKIEMEEIKEANAEWLADQETTSAGFLKRMWQSCKFRVKKMWQRCRFQAEGQELQDVSTVPFALYRPKSLFDPVFDKATPPKKCGLWLGTLAAYIGTFLIQCIPCCNNTTPHRSPPASEQFAEQFTSPGVVDPTMIGIRRLKLNDKVIPESWETTGTTTWPIEFDDDRVPLISTVDDYRSPENFLDETKCSCKVEPLSPSEHPTRRVLCIMALPCLWLTVWRGTFGRLINCFK